MCAQLIKPCRIGRNRMRVDVRPADHQNVVTEHDVDGSRGRFDGTLRALRGRRLTAVDYWDVHNFDSEPAPWDYGDWHHAVMGVQLGTDLGPVTLTWTSTFYPYGVEVFHEPIEHHLVLSEAGPERVGPNGDGTSSWGLCLGSVIRGTACHWERLEIGPSRRADGSIAGPPRSSKHPNDLPVGSARIAACADDWSGSSRSIWSQSLSALGALEVVERSRRETVVLSDR